MSAAKCLAMVIGLFGFFLTGIDAKSFRLVPIEDLQSPATHHGIPVQSAMDSDEKTFDVSTEEDIFTTEDTMCLKLMIKYENNLKKLLGEHKFSLPQRIRMMLRLSTRAMEDRKTQLCLQKKSSK